MRRTLGKSDRIKRRQDFSRVFRAGAAASDALITLHAAANDLDRCRLGVGVSTRHGGAVRRNRIRRLCREAFRTCRADLPAGCDYVIVPRVGAEFAIEPLRRSLLTLSARLAKRSQQ